MSCFNKEKKESLKDLVSLDQKNYFPVEFLKVTDVIKQHSKDSSPKPLMAMRVDEGREEDHKVEET